MFSYCVIIKNLRCYYIIQYQSRQRGLGRFFQMNEDSLCRKINKEIASTNFVLPKECLLLAGESFNGASQMKREAPALQYTLQRNVFHYWRVGKRSLHNASNNSDWQLNYFRTQHPKLFLVTAESARENIEWVNWYWVIEILE